MKRGRKDQLTGGTGDVNPQEFVITGTQSAIDVLTQFQLQLPIPRLPTSPGRNLVIEALWADFIHFNPRAGGAGAAVTYAFAVSTSSTAPTSLVNMMNDPKNISQWMKVVETPNLGAGSLQVVEYDCQHQDDLTDQAGHGVLIATDKLFFYLATVGGAAGAVPAMQGSVRIGYRWKDVSLTEYIGIVQSQQ